MKLPRVMLQQTFRAYFETTTLCVGGRGLLGLVARVESLARCCYGLCELFKRLLRDPLVKPNDWSQIRCLILHKGRTRGEDGKSQYSHFRFSHPQGRAISLHHQRVDLTVDGPLLHLGLHLPIR
jgi:hypothetical protein